MERCNKEHNHFILKCESQRSGDIIETTRLKLYEPDPLYFEVVSMHYEEMKQIKDCLGIYKDGLTNKKLLEKLKIRKSTYCSAKKELLEKGEIVQTNDHPKIIKLGGQNNPDII